MPNLSLDPETRLKGETMEIHGAKIGRAKRGGIKPSQAAAVTSFDCAGSDHQFGLRPVVEHLEGNPSRWRLVSHGGWVWVMRIEKMVWVRDEDTRSYPFPTFGFILNWDEL